MRLLYDGVTSPFLGASRWFTIPWAGQEETDLAHGCLAAPPAAPASLTVAKSGSDALLEWNAIAGAGGYDVVRGDVGVLRSSLGNFTLATEQCLIDNSPSTSLLFSGGPSPGGGFWFLVRGVNCAGSSTYDSGEPSQVGLRDAEIAASSGACP
jgi:hypothetical protein